MLEPRPKASKTAQAMHPPPPSHHTCVMQNEVAVGQHCPGADLQRLQPAERSQALWQRCQAGALQAEGSERGREPVRVGRGEVQAKAALRAGWVVLRQIKGGRS